MSDASEMGDNIEDFKTLVMRNSQLNQSLLSEPTPLVAIDGRSMITVR